MSPKKKLYVVFMLCMLVPEFQAAQNETADEENYVSKYLLVLPSIINLTENLKNENGLSWNLENGPNASLQESKLGLDQLLVTLEYPLEWNNSYTSNEQNFTLESFNQQDVREEEGVDVFYGSINDYLKNEIDRSGRTSVLVNHTLTSEPPLISRSSNIMNSSAYYEGKPNTSLDVHEYVSTDEVMNENEWTQAIDKDKLSVATEQPLEFNSFSSNKPNSTLESFKRQDLTEEHSKNNVFESFLEFLKHKKHIHKLVPANHSLKIEVPLVSSSRNSVNFSIEHEVKPSLSLNAYESAFTDDTVMDRREYTLESVPPKYTQTSKDLSYKSLSEFLKYEIRKHRSKPANHTLKNEIQLMPRSGNVVNISKYYEDKSNLSQDVYVSAFKSELMNSPSPCLNGGTFIVINGKYMCLCGPDYKGLTCEIYTGVCQQPFKPNDSLPCISHGKSCRPVSGGGFVCESDLISSRKSIYHNSSNIVECVEGSLCPDNWHCFNVNQTTDNYRCEPPHNELLYPDLQGVNPYTTRKRRDISGHFCKDNLCQHGAKCKRNRCICLMHYIGRYCENEVNYCTSNPCKEGIPCEPRSGGYNCDCPVTHTGIRCEIPKRIVGKQMKSPHFLFAIQQYSGMSFQYCFYANTIGELPTVKVYFGDGGTKKLHEIDFTRLNDAKNQPLKRVFPALNFVNTDPQLVVFEHTYKKARYYNLTVEVFNSKHLVYTSSHTVRVDPSQYCKLTTELRNCVKSVGVNLTEYTRRDHILILSDTSVNCSHVQLSYAWGVHQLKTKFETHTEENIFPLGPAVPTNESHLNIYPYSLPFGVYAAQLNITMKKPRLQFIQSALTWFKIKEERIVARLVEGSLQQVRWGSPVILDASESFNPNMPPNQQNNLMYAWTCAATGPLQEEVTETVDTFCPYSTDIPLLATGPILTVPPRSLLLHWEYVFVLLLSESTDPSKYYHNLTESMVALTIEVVPDDTPILTIACMRNCVNNEVNPYDMAILEAVCTTCTKSVSEEVGAIEWTVTGLCNDLNPRTQPEDERDSLVFRSLNSSTLILKAGVMVGHERLCITLSVIENAQNSSQQNADTSSKRHLGAERVINLDKPPEPGYCTIEPQRGYALLTFFHVFCYNFKDKNRPLRYETTQFTNMTDTETSLLGTLVGYEMESEIHNIRLAAGLPEHDHLTLIRTIVSSKYTYLNYDFNVTVFPLHYYLKSSIKVLNFLTHMAKDETSNLGLMKGTDSTFASTQMIKMTAESTVNLLNSDYVRYIDVIELQHMIQSIEDCLTDYLNQQPVLNAVGLKHYAIALDAILSLPRYHSFSASNAIRGKLLENIIQIIDHLKSKHVYISKEDVEDLASSVMSAAANLLKKPINARNHKFSPKPIRFTQKNDEKSLQAPQNEISYINQVKLANFTRRVMTIILAYGHLIIQHKANHEESTLCQSHGPNLKFSVQKNSPNNLNENGLFIGGCVGLVPNFSRQQSEFNSGFSMYVLYIEENPFWWHPKAIEMNFPLVQLLMNDAKSKPVKVPTKVIVQNPERMPYKTIHGHLEIHPYWTLNDFDIQVNRVQVPKGGKLIVQFMPNLEHHKIQVIVKKAVRPELIDFWKEANEIPNKESENGTIQVESYTIYVDKESTSNEDFYYIGVLPHIDTLHALSGENGQQSHLTTHDDAVYDDADVEVKHKKEKAKIFKSRVMKVQEPTNNTLPFEYAAYSVRCLALNTSDANLHALNDCHVRPATTFAVVVCQCEDFEMLTASFQSVDSDLHMARSVQFFFPFIDDPLTFYLIFFVLILFLIILLWALWMDYDDKLHREIIFLADNDPRHSNFYLLIVQTGRRPRAGTTSNVAIQLIGEGRNSEVHILKSAHRPVLRRGSQEWFVLKTEAPLGNISWINLWHDHLGASPYWYCSKLIVHDIQTNEMWFFFAEQWLAPLYGDGKISCSVYSTPDTQVFQKRSRIGDGFLKGIGDGFHGWISPFYKNAGNSYTRCQRVTVAFVHVLMMMLIVIHLFNWPSQDDDLSENSRAWTNRNLYNGICTALIVFPFHLFLTLAFMCVSPKPPWWYTPVYWRQFMILDMPNDYRAKYDEDPLKVTNAQSDRYYTMAYTEGMKKSSIPPENRQNNLPMIGRNVGQEWFCLPHWFKYILWIILVIFVIISIFFIYFNGVEHSTVTGYSTLVTLIIAIMFSVLVLEMAKVILFAIYHSIASRKKLTVENRSDLAFFMEDEYKVEPALIPQRLKELEQLKEEDMYRPIPEQRAYLLQRNAMKESSVRSMITDICIFLLFLFLLLIALNGITDSLGYLNVRNVKNLIQGRSGFGRVRLDMVTEHEGFFNYLNGSLIPNLYQEKNYNGRPMKESGQTADLTNHLIGVPRLRQIRVHKDDCKELNMPDQNWASRCKVNYHWLEEDTSDYNPKWQKLDKTKPGYHRVTRPVKGTDGDPAAWMYEPWWTSAKASSIGVATSYSGGGYVALLGRNRQASWKSLEYLRSNDWFDNLTVAVFLEFTLYNPNRNLVSAVTIIAENTPLGSYEVRSSVELVKVEQVNDMMPFIVFALFTLLVIALIMCVHRDGFRIKKLRRWTYFGNIWYALNIVLAILGLIAAFCLLERTFLLATATETLREPDVEKFVQFNVLLYWDQFLIVVIALMLFTVILQTWHLISVDFKCHQVMTVLQVSSHSLMCYAVVFLIFLCAFSSAGYLLFATMTYQFRNLLDSFVSMVGFSQYHSYQDTCFGKLFFLAFFVMYFFIFRWGFVLILIDKCRRVTRVILQRRWLEPVIVSFMQMNLASVRDFGRRGFMRSQADSLIDEYVKASFRNALARLRAMELIVAIMNEQRKLDPLHETELVTKCKEIAMAAMVIDYIEGRMQHKMRRQSKQKADEKFGSTIKHAFTKEKKAAAFVRTHLKIIKLRETLDKLDDAIDQIIVYWQP